MRVRDHYCFPIDTTYQSLKFDPRCSDFENTFWRESGKVDCYGNGPCLNANLLRADLDSVGNVTLRPMGSTILRQVSFETLSNELTQRIISDGLSDSELLSYLVKQPPKDARLEISYQEMRIQFRKRLSSRIPLRHPGCENTRSFD